MIPLDETGEPHRGSPGRSAISFSAECSRGDLDAICARIPAVSDRLLIDLVNGVQVSEEQLRYRRRQGVASRLLACLSGDARKRALLFDGNVVAGFECLIAWIEELTARERSAESALVVTQRSLLEARAALRRHARQLAGLAGDLSALERSLGALAEQVGARLDEIDTRIGRLELRAAADDDLERALARWAGGDTYRGLPWIVAVPLLAHEVFAGPAGRVEAETGSASCREGFARRVWRELRGEVGESLSLASALDQAASALAFADAELCAWLLHPSQLASPAAQPLLFSVGATLELVSLPEEDRPPRPARVALALWRARFGAGIRRVLPSRELFEAIAAEAAAQHRADRQRVRELAGAGTAS
jgi:hypothetical protein